MRENLEDRCAHMRKIPDKAFKWAESLFDIQGYIYYEREGKIVKCFCGSCGAKYEGVSRLCQDPFYAGAQHYISARHNKETTCENCGIRTQFKSMGKVKDRIVKAQGRWALGQRMGADEFVFRIFDTMQILYKDRPAEYDHLEYIRVFLRPGKKAQKDYYVKFWYGGERWIDHNLGGMQNIGLPDCAMICPETFKAIKGTPMFKYVPEPEKREEGYSYPIIRYYEAAAHYVKDFEMIVKTGADKLVHRLVWKDGTGYRGRGKTCYDRLGVRKERLKEIVEKKGDLDTVMLYQAEKKSGKRWSEKEIGAYKMIDRILNGQQKKTIESLYKLTSPVKMKKYLLTLMPDDKLHPFRSEVQEYIDYIVMRKKAGYDLTNEIFLFPKDLHRRHNEMVLETEKEALEKRSKEVNEKYPGIAKRYKKLMEKYSAAAGGYYIRPAKDAAEIVLEGRILHHCVGGDNYLSKHASGKSSILFVRRADDRDTPYVTVEISGNKILQWYGAYDRKDERAGIHEELMQAWLDTYCAELEKRTKTIKNDTKTAKIVKNRKKTA